MNVAPVMFGVGAMVFALRTSGTIAWMLLVTGFGLLVSPGYQLLSVSRRADRKALGRTLSLLFAELTAEPDPYRRLGPTS